MNIFPIRTEKDYRNALKRIDELLYAEPGSEADDELEIITMLVEAYEEKHYALEAPDPIEAIKFRMEQSHMAQSDLIPIIGSKSRVSEILRKKRKLTVEMIRNLHTSLGIPVEALISDYSLG